VTWAPPAGGAAHSKRTARYVKRFLGRFPRHRTTTDAARRRPRRSRCRH